VKVLEPIPTAGMTEGDLPALLSRTRSEMDAARHELFAGAAAGFD
jgi:hypothetical protein